MNLDTIEYILNTTKEGNTEEFYKYDYCRIRTEIDRNIYYLEQLFDNSEEFTSNFFTEITKPFKEELEFIIKDYLKEDVSKDFQIYLDTYIKIKEIEFYFSLILHRIKIKSRNKAKYAYKGF